MPVFTIALYFSMLRILSGLLAPLSPASACKFIYLAIILDTFLFDISKTLKQKKSAVLRVPWPHLGNNES